MKHKVECICQKCHFNNNTIVTCVLDVCCISISDVFGHTERAYLYI